MLVKNIIVVSVTVVTITMILGVSILHSVSHPFQ